LIIASIVVFIGSIIGAYTVKKITNIILTNITEDFKSRWKSYVGLILFLVGIFVGVICIIIFSIVMHHINKEIDEERLRNKII